MSHDPINGTPQAGQDFTAPPSNEGHAAGPVVDEAARLAEAQAERLARKSAENVKAVLEPKPEVTPKLVGSLSIQLFDNGQASINMPGNNYDLALEMIRLLHVTMIRNARAEGAKVEAEKRKVPFMKRLFQGAGKPG